MSVLERERRIVNSPPSIGVGTSQLNNSYQLQKKKEHVPQDFPHTSMETVVERQFSFAPEVRIQTHQVERSFSPQVHYQTHSNESLTLEEVVNVVKVVIEVTKVVVQGYKFLKSYFSSQPQQRLQFNSAFTHEFHQLVKQLENSREKGKFMPTIIEKGSSVMTIGYGHQCSVAEAERFKNGISTQQAEELYKQDQAASVSLARTVYNSIYGTNQNPDPFSKLSQGFQLLMSELTFNLGPNGLKKYVKLMKFVSEGKFYEAVAESNRGCNQDASLNKGLANRVKALQDFFMSKFDSKGNPK